MITELSNYVNSLGDKLNWLLFESKPLEEGEYFIYVKDSENPVNFKLHYHFEVDKKGKLTADVEEVAIHEFITKSQFNKKLFLSRAVSSNKTLVKQIYTNNPFVIQLNTKNLEKLQSSVDAFYATAGDLYENIFTRTEINGEYAIAQSIFRDLIGRVGLFHPGDEKKITILFDMPLEIIQDISDDYFKKKIYNVNDYTIENGNYGIHSFKIDTNQKKPYKFSQSSFAHSFRLTDIRTAINLNVFEVLLRLKENRIPNPLPVFIYEEQLNGDIIETLKQDGKFSYRGMIERIFKEKGADQLGNYYLLNWSKGMSISINDFDFVEQFVYQLEDFRIIKLMQNQRESDDVKNIFDFEFRVANAIFNNMLITGKESPSFHYFDDLGANRFFNKQPCKSVINNIEKYRYSIYEYIYKSKTDAITGKSFYNLIISNVTDLILSSEKLPFDSIRNILNILFSLNHKFDKNNTNFGGRYMPSEIPKYFERIGEIVKSSENHIQDDYEYAFCAGQLIYYLLKQSRAEEKKHSLIEPFINRTTVEAFNDQLIRVFNQYKHAIKFDHPKFNRLFEEVIGYRPTTSYKEMMPILFAGYFGDNIVFTKSKDTEEETN